MLEQWTEDGQSESASDHHSFNMLKVNEQKCTIWTVKQFPKTAFFTVIDSSYVSHTNDTFKNIYHFDCNYCVIVGQWFVIITLTATFWW